MGSSDEARLLVVRQASMCSHLCLGFDAGCSLKNHGVDEEADSMFEMGAETMRLPMEEKMEFEQGDDGVSFG